MHRTTKIAILALLAVTFAHRALAAVTVKTCEFLSTYDQLSNYVGKPGFYVVRDAGNTRTGQHGDPSVSSGWAMYTWDTTSGWIKVAEKESLDIFVKEMGGYYTKAEIDALLNNIADNTVVSNLSVKVTKNESDIVALGQATTNNSNSISELYRETDRLDAKIRQLTPDGGGDVPSTVLDDIADLQTNQASLSNKVNDLSTTVDGVAQDVNSTKETIASLTNNQTTVEIDDRNNVTVRNLRDALVAIKSSQSAKITTSGTSPISFYNHIVDISQFAAMSRDLSELLTPESLNVLICTNVNMKSWPNITLYVESPYNFEMIVPNEENLRNHLPIHFGFDLSDGVTWVHNGTYDVTQTVHKLPILMRGIKPYNGSPLIVMAQSLSDDTDWTPSITNVNVVYDRYERKFHSNGQPALLGKNLHCITAIKITYTNSLGVDTTLVLDTLQEDGYTNYGYYDHVAPFVMEGANNVVIGSGNRTSVTITVVTPNGTGVWTGSIDS